jgi:hypothetical protein
MNYELIKQAAAELGISYRDIIALAPQNDPFYVGTPKDVDQAQWFSDVWEAAGYSSGVHLRRVHYWCVSQGDLKRHDGKPYENTDKAWKYLCQASKAARYLGLVRIRDIADNKNPTPHIAADYDWPDPEFNLDIPEFDYPRISIYGTQESLAQPYHLEVWCEKSTMNDVLIPVCSRFKANLATFEGEVSVTACYDLVQRIKEANKPARIFYISDFDPAGLSMPVAAARKVEFMLDRYELSADVRLTPIVLTADQVKQYRLPRTPIKQSEKRAATFEDAHGTGAVELDALEALYPGTLGQIVTDGLSHYYSQQAARKAAETRAAFRAAVNEQVQAVMGSYKAEIDALRGMTDELAQIDVTASHYAVTAGPADVTEDDSWLFDSSRDYLGQVERYKAFKNGDEPQIL